MLMLMRVLHIVLGTFWVGTLLFTALFLFPAMRDAGPDGAKVGAQLMKRNFVNIMPIAAIITILAGVWLLWKVSGGFENGYMGTGPGKAYSLGGATAIIALIIGLSVVRPSMLKAARLSQTGEPQAMAEAGALRARAGKANLWIAILLLITVVAMAVGRIA
jgi:uncharacterized membrane protein